MSTALGDNIRKRRLELGMTQQDLADKMGYKSKTTINKIEMGVNDVVQSKILAFAKALDTTTSYLMGWKEDLFNESLFQNQTNNHRCLIPVLGRVQAGLPIEAIEEIIDYEEISEEMARCGEYFGLQIKGESMEPKFSQGDVVIVRKQPDVESGQIGIVIVDGTDATVKRIVKHDEGGISLIALNPSYPPKFYTNNEIANMPITIVGRVVELRAKF